MTLYSLANMVKPLVCICFICCSQTCKLFVGNIIRGTPDEELKAVFDQFGTVAECSVVSDYAFVVSHHLF